MLHRVLLIGCCLTGITARPALADEQVDFSRDIRPILSDNCFKCHGPDASQRKADLRLDTKDGLLADAGDYAVVVPGDAGKSEMIRRIISSDPDERMPPPKSKLELTDAQLALLRQWIAAGAPWQQHWVFRPVARPPLPQVSRAAWPRNAIDRFVLARLEAEGFEASPEATKERLLRRVTLDLTGLPPTLDELDAFLADVAPGAYQRVVDRLLASRSYGERMAWDWLDAARYADTNGFQGDRERTMWPWRDWVVRVLNENMPYDRFTVEQIAGDLLPEATFEQKLATGFCRNHMINGEGGRIAEENRIEYILDQTETLGTIWMGLTLTCCRCHDHKFDPVSRREYYQMFAFFNQTPVNGGGGDPQSAPRIDAPSYQQQIEIEAIERRIAVLQEQIENGGAEQEQKSKLEEQRKQAEKRIGDIRKSLAKVMIMQDMDKPRKTFMLTKGLYNQPGEEVTAAVPAILPPLPADAKADRLALARWLIDPSHPLTARVTVNRIWQTFFGAGLVKTPEDFGAQGEKPTHARLLDWLAAEFVSSGWDVKAMHRRIVTSATYRQTAKTSPQMIDRDPDNRLLARGPRYRIPSWMIRDQALAVSGLLVDRLGGPSVKPYQPGGVWAEATFGKKRYQQDKGEKLYRRSLYTYWRRIIGPTMFFDTSPRQKCSVKVARTNTPLHALLTLNDVTFVEAARAMAQRVMRSGSTDAERVATAFRLATSRTPTGAENELLLGRLEELKRQYGENREDAEKLLMVGESPRDEKLDAVQHAAFTGICLLILNLDETLTN